MNVLRGLLTVTGKLGFMTLPHLFVTGTEFRWRSRISASKFFWHLFYVLSIVQQEA